MRDVLIHLNGLKRSADGLKRSVPGVHGNIVKRKTEQLVWLYLDVLIATNREEGGEWIAQPPGNVALLQLLGAGFPSGLNTGFPQAKR